MTQDLCATERDQLDSYLDAVECLPPTPGLMIRLIELFGQPERDVDEIVELMRHDPSVTTELLRRCNSSFFGDEEPVTDVRESVFRLGFYEIYRIIVALSGQKAMSLAKLAGSIEVEYLWRHSVITAITGGAMARQLGESEGNAFTAGLLHDVGKIVLASAEGAKYAEMLRRHNYFGTSLNMEEMLEFGFGHGEIGARLLSQWNVPGRIFLPVMCHHHTTWLGSLNRLAAIVSLANLMAHRIEESTSETLCETPEAANAMDLLDLKHEDMPALELLARNEINRLGALFATNFANGDG